jgi:hypothetical protein
MRPSRRIHPLVSKSDRPTAKLSLGSQALQTDTIQRQREQTPQKSQTLT